MREPGFAAAWAMPAWTAPVALFTDGKPVLDSLTGQPVQEHDHVVQDEQSAAVSVGPTFAEGRTRYYGIPRSGIPTKMYDDPASAIDEEAYSDLIWKALNRLWDCLLFLNRDVDVTTVMDKFDRETTERDFGILRPNADGDLPMGVRLYSRLLKGSPHVLVKCGDEFLGRIPGKTYSEIEADLNRLLIEHNVIIADATVAP